jgi:hypothetical protein
LTSFYRRFARCDGRICRRRSFAKFEVPVGRCFAAGSGAAAPRTRGRPQVSLDNFVDIVSRNFKQPMEGLGLNNSPSAHMWRTMFWLSRFL